MTPNPDDISFLFPYAEGHFGCICSRCLNRITKQEIVFRVLRSNSLLAFEEYRYCESCQRQAAFTPQRSSDVVLAQLTREMREHPRFRATKREMDNLIQSLKATRTGIARARKKRAEARATEPDPWSDPGFLMPLAVALGKKRS
jgi:hypothetical protein